MSEVILGWKCRRKLESVAVQEMASSPVPVLKGSKTIKKLMARGLLDRRLARNVLDRRPAGFELVEISEKGWRAINDPRVLAMKRLRGSR